MKIKLSAFGSDNEKTLFKTLQSHWSDRFDLWPNLPFTNIIDIGDSQLSAKEEEFIYKTSVDCTLCKKDGKPLLSIEFDGLGHGFSKGGEYIQLVQNPEDPYRKLKLDLKLKIAERVGYPLFVASYDEKEPIGPDLHLTIVDGIIGMTLAGKHCQYIIDNLPLNEEPISTLSENELHEYIESSVWEAEFRAELRWNPFESLAAEYLGQAKEKGLWLEVVGFYFPHSERGTKNAVAVGSIVQTAFGEIRKEVWVRDIQGLGSNLALSISKLLALKEALDLYGKKG